MGGIFLYLTMNCDAVSRCDPLDVYGTRRSKKVVEQTDQFGDVSLPMWRMTNSPAKLPFIVEAEHESFAGVSP